MERFDAERLTDRQTDRGKHNGQDRQMGRTDRQIEAESRQHTDTSRHEKKAETKRRETQRDRERPKTQRERETQRDRETERQRETVETQRETERGERRRNSIFERPHLSCELIFTSLVALRQIFFSGVIPIDTSPVTVCTLGCLSNF